MQEQRVTLTLQQSIKSRLRGNTDIQYGERDYVWGKPRSVNANYLSWGLHERR